MGVICGDAFCLKVDDSEVPVVIYNINRYQHEIIILIEVCLFRPFEKAFRSSSLLEFGEPLGASVVASWKTSVDLWSSGLLSSSDLAAPP